MDKLRRIKEAINDQEDMNKVGVECSIQGNTKNFDIALESAFRGRREHPMDLREAHLDVLLDTDKMRIYIVPDKYTEEIKDDYHFIKHNVCGNYPRFDEIRFDTGNGEGIIYTLAFPMERKMFFVNLKALHYFENMKPYLVSEFVRNLLDERKSKRKEEKQAVRKRK